MKRVTCLSGIKGYQCKLRESYDSYSDFLEYSQLFGLAERLGYDSALDAWRDNPTIQGSTVPGDFRALVSP